MDDLLGPLDEWAMEARAALPSAVPTFPAVPTLSVEPCSTGAVRGSPGRYLRGAPGGACLPIHKWIYIMCSFWDSFKSFLAK